MHARLLTLDPRAAAAIEPGNSRRVVRALEVIELTGPAVLCHDADRASSCGLPCCSGLRIDRVALDERRRPRVARMWEAGLLDEMRRLATAGCARPHRLARARLRAGARRARRRA